MIKKIKTAFLRGCLIQGKIFPILAHFVFFHHLLLLNFANFFFQIFCYCVSSCLGFLTILFEILLKLGGGCGFFEVFKLNSNLLFCFCRPNCQLTLSRILLEILGLLRISLRIPGLHLKTGSLRVFAGSFRNIGILRRLGRPR